MSVILEAKNISKTYNQGSLSVDNHFGGGAVFRIILPIYESLKVRG